VLLCGLNRNFLLFSCSYNTSGGKVHWKKSSTHHQTVWTGKIWCNTKSNQQQPYMSPHFLYLSKFSHFFIIKQHIRSHLLLFCGMVTGWSMDFAPVEDALGPGGFEDASDPKMSPRTSTFDCLFPVVLTFGWLVTDCWEAASKPEEHYKHQNLIFCSWSVQHHLPELRSYTVKWQDDSWSSHAKSDVLSQDTTWKHWAQTWLLFYELRFEPRISWTQSTNSSQLTLYVSSTQQWLKAFTSWSGRSA
jgi:hypothetical protein